LITFDVPLDYERVEIYPVSDLHLGDALSDIDAFLAFIKHINSAPNRYVIVHGDMINNNLKSSVGSVYEDIVRPRDQVKEVKRLLEQIKDRILVIVPGNHEDRSKKETDQCITEEIATHLGIPYREEDALVKIAFRYDSGKSENCYTVYVAHGCAGGKRPGSALNNAEALSMNILADVYVVGHSHKRIAHKATFRIPDTINNVIREIEQLYIVSGAWTHYGGYGKKKLYRPQSRGSVPFTLEGKTRKKEVWAKV
jgi:predicted phosphodiesterase